MLDKIVPARRNTKAAMRLLIRLMKKQGCLPKRIVTDKLRSMAQHGVKSCPQSNIDRTDAHAQGRAHRSHLGERE